MLPYWSVTSASVDRHTLGGPRVGNGGVIGVPYSGMEVGTWK